MLSKMLIAVLLLSPLSVVAESDEPKTSTPSIGLALGSGGAGGLAHIAMLQVFDDLKLKPDQIVGTSIGAVIGVLYAAGLSAEQIEEIFDEFGGSRLDALSHLALSDTELNLSDLFDVDIDNGGLIDSTAFLDFLAAKIEARTFKDLMIPMKVVATDYWTGETIVLSKGDLFAAVKASIAVPGLFSPVPHGERLLVDGGTSNPLPFHLLRGSHDLVVAIDVTGSRAPGDETKVGFTEVFFKTFEIMQQSIISAQMSHQKPDVYIKPDTSNIRLLHFNRLKQIHKQAEPAADELKQKLLELLDKKQQHGS
ncbi:MAG: patatin-like phospholipase family protein [Desulfuromonadaceae bacterium]